ncbi:MAG TPA: metal-dependent hydrolase [Terriglobales bacterium]|nr:metal-dependent hydrolase [Terriglobales bacterium]
MEPITHFLTGACMGRAGLNRKTALATATVTLAAEAPDLDVLGRLHGPVFGFEHHRGFTHSFLGLVLVAALVTGLMYSVWRLRGRRIKNPHLPPRWGLLFGFAYLAGLSHLLLDFTNNYGVRPFWPLSEMWYSWDIVFIVEPVLPALLLLGLVLPGFFSLIRSEIGDRQRGPRGRLAAWLALSGMVLLWAVRHYEHRRAVAALDSRTYEGAEPLRVSAYPSWNNPFRWYGVVETRDFFALAPIHSSEPEIGRVEILFKPEETPVTLAAKQSYLGRSYLDWAQYPFTVTEVLDSGGYMVEFEDLRFANAWRGSGRRPLSAAVELDRNLKVTAEVFGLRRRKVPPEESRGNPFSHPHGFHPSTLTSSGGTPPLTPSAPKRHNRSLARCSCWHTCSSSWPWPCASCPTPWRSRPWERRCCFSEHVGPAARCGFLWQCWPLPTLS